MKTFTLALAIGAAAIFGASLSQAQPVPGGNPNCVTNWVGGACGVTTNNGGSGPEFCDRKKNVNKPECRCQSRGKSETAV